MESFSAFLYLKPEFLEVTKQEKGIGKVSFRKVSWRWYEALIREE
jgi:hypothetical protein